MKTKPHKVKSFSEILGILDDQPTEAERASKRASWAFDAGIPVDYEDDDAVMADPTPQQKINSN